jgi:hypothetical protein
MKINENGIKDPGFVSQSWQIKNPAYFYKTLGWDGD